MTTSLLYFHEKRSSYLVLSMQSTSTYYTLFSKNFTKGYSSIQVKLRDATAIGSYGPTMTQLEELSNATHHPTNFADMIYILEKRLNDHGKYWKHVYKVIHLLVLTCVFRHWWCCSTLSCVVQSVVRGIQGTTSIPSGH